MQRVEAEATVTVSESEHNRLIVRIDGRNPVRTGVHLLFRRRFPTFEEASWKKTGKHFSLPLEQRYALDDWLRRLPAQVQVEREASYD